MTEIYWLNPISGSFTNPDYWSGDMVPGASDDAIIDAVGANPYTVTASTSVSVNSIQIAADAKLLMASGTFTAVEGTGLGANDGVIQVAGGADLAFSGQMTNSGKIRVGSHVVDASLLIAGYATLSGGGQVKLAGAAGDSIEGVTPNGGVSVLVNADNTISGSGAISNLFLYNESAGVINANSKNPLTVGVNVSNSNIMEATNHGTLTFQYAFEQNKPSGIILATDESTVIFRDTRVKYGTLITRSGGSMLGFDSYFQSFTNMATLTLNGTSDLVYNFDNRDNITLNGQGNILVGLTLNGGGHFELSEGSDISGDGARPALINVNNTIFGSGGIFEVNVYNEEDGIIDATGTYTMVLGTRDHQFSTNLTNSGTIESTGQNGLRTNGAIDNTGVIVATVGTITLQSGKLTNDGVVSAAGGEVDVDVKVVGDGDASVDGGALYFKSIFDQPVAFSGSGGVLGLGQSQAYTAAITGFSSAGDTSLDLGDISFIGPGEASYSGSPTSGVLTVTDGTHTARITLDGDYLGVGFVASSDGGGGTDVVAQSVDVPAPSAHAFVAAMAGLGASVPPRLEVGGAVAARETLLTSPRVAIA